MRILLLLFASIAVSSLTRAEEEPAMGTLSVITIPSSAEVRVNGKLLGRSALRTKVPAGDSLPLEISHPEARPFSEIIQIRKGQILELRIPLTLKPAALLLTVDTTGAEVTVDDASVGVALQLGDGRLVLPAGRHTLRISAAGYQTEERELELKGGEERQLGRISLATESNPLAIFFRPETERSQFLLGLILGDYTTSTFQGDSESGFLQLGAFAEYKAFHVLGLRLGAAYDFSVSRLSSSYLGEMTGYALSLSTPWYLYHFSEGDSRSALFLLPEVTRIRNAYDTGVIAQQNGLGLGVGWETLPRPGQLGFSARLSLQRYLDGDGLTGLLAGHVDLAVLYGL